LRAGGGGNAACRRVAGSIAAGAGEVATGAVFFAAVLVADAEVTLEEVTLEEVLGTTLRAIGLGFGSGIFGLAEASAAKPVIPIASTRLVTKAVDRNAAARM
jgi:hypothetical protein